MKTTIALLLLLSIPCEILSFSAQSTTTAAIQRRETTRNKFIFKAADDNKSDVGLLEPQQPVATDSPTETNGAKADEECILAEEEELTETQKLLKKVKQAGTAGAISYAAWELAFWGVSGSAVTNFSMQERTDKMRSNSHPLSLLSFSNSLIRSRYQYVLLDTESLQVTGLTSQTRRTCKKLELKLLHSSISLGWQCLCA